MSEETTPDKETNADTPWNSAKKTLEQRCKSAKIPFLVDVEEFFGESVEIQLPAGRAKRTLWLFPPGDIDRILSIPFEEYSFLDGYEAISLTIDQTSGARRIEAEIRSLHANRSGKFFKALEHPDSTGTKSVTYRTLQLPPSTTHSKFAISIGPASQEFRILCRPHRASPRLTLTITGQFSERHDEKVALLERISSALFFQIEGLFGTPIGLQRPLQNRIRGARFDASIDDIRFPETEYDAAPIALYFYATSANGLPLVQFLAFYQTIEFYFPVCHSAEARRRVRSIVKDPTFRFDRDTDIMKILDAVSVGTSSGHVSERAMLRATVHECVDQRDLARFITSEDERAEFFKTKHKELTAHTLPLENPDLDLRQIAADRIYDIRCRIVHTKSGDESSGYKLLLPNSKEAGMLHHDIALVQFIARKALIYASTPMRTFSI